MTVTQDQLNAYGLDIIVETGEDGAVVVFIDTTFEPGGETGHHVGMRVWVNDHLVSHP